MTINIQIITIMCKLKYPFLSLNPIHYIHPIHLIHLIHLTHLIHNNTDNNHWILSSVIHHCLSNKKCKWSSGWTSLLQMIIWMDLPLVNHHLDGLACCKLSSQWTRILQMIICTASKRVLILRTWSLIRTFLAFWVLNGSLFIFHGLYFHCFGFINAKNVNSVCPYTTMVLV